MPAPSEFHFYENTLLKVNEALAGYVSATSASVSGALTGIATSMLMIYMVLWGWATMRGLISEPVTDGLARIIRITIVAALALNVGIYNGYISDALWDTPEAMASIVTGVPYTPTGSMSFLDTLWGKVYDFGAAFWEKAFAPTVPNFGLILVAIMIWAVGLLATLYGAFLLILSKIALAVLLALGPIFMLAAMFEGTKRFTEAWLGQAMNYVFLVVLTAAAIKLMLTVLEAYLGSAEVAAAVGDPSVGDSAAALAIAGISFVVMMQLPSIASALGGGAAVSTLGAAGWAYSKATGGLSAMRPTNMRRSYNKAAADVRLAKAAATKVPMAVYRRVTGAGRNRVDRAA